MENRPYSEACNRNKEPIKEILDQYVVSGSLLEIGSGTGQHAAYLASYFDNITWHTSDHPNYHAGIKSWIESVSNVMNPIFYLAGHAKFPSGDFDYIYSANTLHIMSYDECKTLIKDLGANSKENTLVFFYGPFKYENKFTSKSNESFDESLKSRNSQSGIRNFEDITSLMNKEGFKFLKDHNMPANNQLLVFKKTT